MAKQHIVIIGGGFAGAYCAQELEKRLRGLDADVLLIDRNNYLLFYPLLIEAGTGSLEPRHAVVAIRAFLKRTVFHMGEVVSIDRELRLVRYRISGLDETEAIAEAPYDHLVLSPGSVTLLPNVPGLLEFGLQLKGLSDAVGLRDRVIRMLEAADATSDPATRDALLRIVVVGGNFTGVEVAGEFSVFMREACADYPNLAAGDCNMTLVERDVRILKALDEDLSEYAANSMRKRGIDVRIQQSVVSIAADHVILNTGERIETHTVIWCAGIAPNPLIKDLGLPVDARGYLKCERDMRVVGEERIWGIGDSAVNVGADGLPYPATAQHATREGKFVARAIDAVLRGKPIQPVNIVSQGSLAALGCRTGVARIMGIKLSGFAAWFMWRTVYLLKMPGFGRKMRVALDWTLGLFFRREHVQMGIHSRRTERKTIP